MLRALVLTSCSPRHVYFANIIATKFNVAGVISEPKNDYFEDQKKNAYVGKHFDNLKLFEDKYFNKYENFPDAPLLKINKNEINSEFALSWAENKNADVVCLFGTGILSNAWLSKFKGRVINLHLGCSPRYRGSATLFWPFYNNELNYVGATIHLAEEKIDAGKIIKIINPKIDSKDNYYDITCKVIKDSIGCFPVVVERFVSGLVKALPQKLEDQKFLYRKKDFTEEALRKVMDLYGP